MNVSDLNILITWALNEEYCTELQREFPSIQFSICLDTEGIEKKIETADIVYAGLFTPEHLKKASKLKWLQFNGHGLNSFLFPELVDSDVIITNSVQVHSIPIAEHVFSLMLNHSRKITVMKEGQLQGKWMKQEIYSCLEELYGKTVLLIGVGNIGEEVAKRAKVFGMKVWGVRKNAERASKNVDQMFSLDELKIALQEADFVIATLPSTKETVGMFGEKELAVLKKTAYIINVGRGDAFVDDDLIAALETKQIAGAGLDVFRIEPLPEASPFYTLDNVMLTPHVSGTSPLVGLRQYSIFSENLRRFIWQEPLKNVVNKQAGY